MRPCMLVLLVSIAARFRCTQSAQIQVNQQMQPTVNLMSKLGDFKDENWGGYSCTFSEWATCVNSTSSASCGKCRSSIGNQSITCTMLGKQRQCHFPAGGIFPVVEQFTIPPNVAIVGAANPNDASRDKSQQQTDIAGQTWFIVPAKNTLCGDDPLCKDKTALGPTACSGDPHHRRQGFLMSTNSMLKNINFQGADLGRAASEGTLCGPGAIELPGCLDGNGCDSWDKSANGNGVAENVVIQNVRLSDAVMRANISQMSGDCATGEALDNDGNHVRAHQVSVWVAKLPSSEKNTHSNVLVDNLVSMNSRADGFNVHGATHGITLQNSHIENSGDDCIGVWSTGIQNMTIRNMVTKNCAVTAGVQSNWGSCMGTYAFTSLAVDGLNCYDPFLHTKGCNARTHYTAIHLNHAFAKDCMPEGASLSLKGIEYYASAEPGTPLQRPKCGQCRSCCGVCSTRGFDNLKINYLDSTVPPGSCMKNNAGC